MMLWKKILSLYKMASLTTILYIGISLIALIITISALCVRLFIPGPPGPAGARGPLGPTGISSTEAIIGPTGPLGATGPQGSHGSLGLISDSGARTIGHGSQTLTQPVNGVTFVFESTETKDLSLSIPASNVNVGDIFNIYNMSNQNVYIQPSGFENRDDQENVGTNAYKLNSTIRLALIFITAGANTTSKNFNLMYSLLGSDHLTSYNP
jgi:hypothetical protein